MNSYFAIFKGRLSSLFQYRIAAFAGLLTQIFWGIIKTMILTAFFIHSDSQQPISLAQAITFIWLGQAFLQLLPWNTDKEVESLIRTGNVAYELARPLDLYGSWYSRSLSLRIIPTLMRSIPLLILAILFFGLALPVSFKAGILFVISLFFSLILSSAMTTFFTTTLFWTISGEGLLRLLPHLTMLLSGLVVPLPLFPDWLQPLVSVQPFRGIIDIPIRFYTGIITTHEIFYLGFQIFWILFFIAAGKKLMNLALRHIVIQGG